MNNPSKRGMPGTALVAACVLLVQLALLASSFPLSQAFSGNYNWHIDNPYHLYQLELGKALLKQGALAGLDPFFGAGHMGGVSYNVSARLPVLMAGLLPDTMSSATVYALYVLGCSLIGPLAIVGMARILRWPLLHTALASLAGLAFWWVGALHWYHTAGMVSFVCAAYLSAAYGAWTWAICNAELSRTTLLRALAAGLAGGLGLWLHPLFGVLAAPWFLAFLAIHWREARWRGLCINAALIAAVALAVNLPWILLMLGSPNIVTQQPYQKAIGYAVALKPLLGIWSNGGMGSLLNPLCALICVAAMLRFGRALTIRILPFVAVGAALLLFAAFGALSTRLAILQPNRFLAPAFLFIGLGAAYSAGEFIVWLRRGGRPAVQMAAAACALLVSAYFGREMYREATPGPHGHYGVATTELTETPAVVAQLESWILANTSLDGRILFETSLGRIHGGGHAAGMLALATGREFIGAPYPYSLPEISFWDNSAFGQPIRKVSAAQLSHRLEYYNVGWVIAHSPGLVDLVGSLEDARLVASFGKVRIFKLQRPLSYVLSGTGRIASRGFDKIEVDGAQGPELILRYHWMPGLVATPAAKLEAVQLEADLPPLIKVIAPPGHFLISSKR